MAVIGKIEGHDGRFQGNRDGEMRMTSVEICPVEEGATMPRQAPIALIAPYEKLRDLALKARERYAVPIAVYQGDLQEGVAAARRALSEGASIIVSRGGTALMIAEELGIKVVEIRISGYDVLRTALGLVDPARATAVVGFDQFVDGVQPIYELLKIPVALFRIQSAGELPQVMDEIRRRGLRRVVGDAVSTQVAATLDLEVRLVETGQQAIYESLEKALAIYSNIQDQLKRTHLLETLISVVDETIVLIDGRGRILTPHLSRLRPVGFRHERKLDLTVLGDDLLRLVKQAPAQAGTTSEGVVRINERDYFATVHSLSEQQAESEGAVIIIHDISRIRSIDRNIRRQQRQNAPVSAWTLSDIVHQDPAMVRCVSLAKCFARTDSAVVLYGETGTGKELFAQGIHRHGRRAHGPFVAVNCGAIPPTLIESELFGYVEGAFTGAHRGGRVGLFELAHSGTIFLDEINELELPMQTRLLRVLQEKEVMRIGDSKPIPISVRVIVASNVPLWDEVASGRFRKDLYYRLNVLGLEIPPLRRRPQDIRPLFFHFLDELCVRARRSRPPVAPTVLAWLDQHDWPGNVRELQNFAERYFVWSTELADVAGPFLEEMLEAGLLSKESQSAKAPAELAKAGRYDGSLLDIERRIVRTVLAEEGGNVSRAAERLGIDRNTLKRKAQITASASTRRG
jgi:transcriptional regulator with PAS, ATPase and Fis domain